MKKNRISKLAVMGILSGSLITSANAEQINSTNLNEGSMTILAAGCGAGKCGGPKPDNSNEKSSYTADRGSCGSSRPNISTQRSSYSSERSSCSSSKSNNYYQNSPNTAERTHSCGGVNPNSNNQQSSYTADRDAVYDSLSEAQTADNSKNKNKNADSKKLTEKELTSQLNDKGKELYNSLDSEGKAMALKLANGSCKGKNDCKGQSACKSDKNSCAGENGCKGQGTALFKDKNLAVRIASKKMAEKRTLMNSGKR